MHAATMPAHAFLPRTRTCSLPNIALHLLPTNPTFPHHYQTASFSTTTRFLTKPTTPPSHPSFKRDSQTPVGADQQSPSLTLPHLTAHGEAHMVSISHKIPTTRSATASTTLHFSTPQTYHALTSATLQKGDALAVARIAGLQAAKATSTLIPLAHPGLQITFAGVDIDVIPPPQQQPPPPPSPSSSPAAAAADVEKKRSYAHGAAHISCTINCEGKTGVEMEALVGAQVAGLALYDMLKGVDKGMCLGEGRVIRKTGGKSGAWGWDEGMQRVVKDGEEKED